MKFLIKVFVFLCLGSFFKIEILAAEKTELIKQNWPFNGFFGRFDQSSIQRGFQVYREVCAGCHGVKYISYRDLANIGFTSDEVKSIASEYEILDGPNDEGEMYDRLAKPSDKFVGKIFGEEKKIG